MAKNWPKIPTEILPSKKWNSSILNSSHKKVEWPNYCPIKKWNSSQAGPPAEPFEFQSFRICGRTPWGWGKVRLAGKSSICSWENMGRSWKIKRGFMTMMFLWFPFFLPGVCLAISGTYSGGTILSGLRAAVCKGICPRKDLKFVTVPPLEGPEIPTD